MITKKLLSGLRAARGRFEPRSAAAPMGGRRSWIRDEATCWQQVPRRPRSRQRLGDTLGREIALSAGEAMGEQRGGNGLPVGELQQRREGLAARIGEIDALGRRRTSRWSGGSVA